MCFSKIGKVEKLKGKIALVNFNGKKSRVNISMINGLRVGDRVVCVNNFAVERIENGD
ncbi:MAG: HypC/HybG/HupF family hydrogenase formation chaperone [Candidatus Aenigmatarchaeota archaeon]